MNKIELNSPAGDMDCVKAAIYNGADSIYLGSKFFNARRLANNFSMDDIKSIIKMAHLHGVKIYLTMNTLVRNNELKAWFKHLEQAYLLGIDAIILQELHLIPLIRKYFPGLRIHASTQSSLMNYRAINSFDIDLAVLARELTLDEIKLIRQHTKKELEVFVHGHLCVSYSGQCLISSLIGKRSGNRGVCASSCRKEYNREGYLISPKDLMLANHIKDLSKIGVNAIKIEGRMKDANYVATTTKTYRHQIDTVNNPKNLTNDQIDELKLGFNRDFTTGFLTGNKSIIDYTMPMNRGVYLGKIKHDRLKLEADLEKGDGVGFWHPSFGGKLQGFVLSSLYINNEKSESAKKGDYISIPSRHFFENVLVYQTSKRDKSFFIGDPKLIINDITISGSLDQKLIVTIGDKIVESEIPLQQSKNRSISKIMFIEEFNKSKNKGLIFNITNFYVEKNLFMPLSTLTKLRKEMENVVLSNNVPKRISNLENLPEIKPNKPKCDPKLIVKVYDIKQLKEAIQTKIDYIYFDIFNDDVNYAKELCKDIKFFLDTPVVMTDKDISRAQNIINDIKPDGIVIGNPGLINLKFDGEKHSKYSLNVFNDYSVDALHNKNILPMVSVELNAKQVIDFKNKNIIYYAHGRIPVMHFKGKYHEPYLEDEKGYSFPLREINGNTEMLYSREIATYGHIGPLIDAGIRYFVLDLERDTTTIINAYVNLINGIKQDISMLKKGTSLGNYKKGVA
jgi:U32 family peptidase